MVDKVCQIVHVTKYAYRCVLELPGTLDFMNKQFMKDLGFGIGFRYRNDAVICLLFACPVGAKTSSGKKSSDANCCVYRKSNRR